jgi:two-component system chemotaxis response regulator CheB
LLGGTIYIAPSDYHLLVEQDHTLSLDYSEKVNFSRPAIDVTFQTAAEVYGKGLVCVLLSGSNSDGTNGLLSVKEWGGTAVIQSPASAQVPYMPQQAAAKVEIDHILDAEDMGKFINLLS